MINSEDIFKTIARIAGIGIMITSLLTLSLFNSGCSSTDDSSADSGEVIISLTDAEGDFLTYSVDVSSMKLIRSDGTEVLSLSESTTVDFAQYVDVTEFLTAATVPLGRYDAAELTLDFSNAVITVQDASGNAIPASPVDAEGNPLTTITVAIELNGGTQFNVVPGIPAHFTIDFDLESSNEVVVEGESAIVTVNPVLIADTQMKDPKPHRLRGLLGATDETAASFRVVIRPFLHRNNHRFGSLKVQTTSTTVYEIDGVEYTGEAGFDALANLNKGSAVVAKGILNIETRQYIATEVTAGSSVPWGSKDILKGSVISRDQNSLSVHGGVILRAAGDYIFRENIQVLVNENTRVFKQGDADTLHLLSDISVGQRVAIIGESAITIGEEYVMDATEGTVRMKYSQVTGLIKTVSPLAVETQRINGRRSSVYDFNGTGSDPAIDADPSHYEIDTVSLPLDQLSVDEPIKVRGFPTPFGQAPEDFTAKTLIDVSNVVSHMLAGYTQSGSGTAIATVDSSGMQIILDGVGHTHYLEQAGVVVDLLSLDAAPFVQPQESGEGLFVITKKGSVSVFDNYEAFQLQLNEQLLLSMKVRAVNAFGKYDANTNTLTANKIGVHLLLDELVTE